MIRQVSLRQRLRGDAAAQEIDQVWAALQRSSFTVSHHGQHISMSELVGALCVATGILLVYRDAGGYSVDVANLLTGLKGCVLQESARLVEATSDHQIHSCCGAICSLLLAQNDVTSLPQALHSSIAAAVGEVVVQQALAAAVQTPRAHDSPFSAAPILVYASNIFAAFSGCVLAARTPTELQPLLEPLAVSVAAVCLPDTYASRHELSIEQRAVLQRSMVPVLQQAMQRSAQQAAAAEPPPEPVQQHPAYKNHQILQLPVLHRLSKLLANDAQLDATSQPPTQPDEASTAAAVKCAQMLSMAYHAPSSSASPHLSSLVSTILAQLVQSSTSALQLAQHIIRPPCFHTTAQLPAGCPGASLHMTIRAANGIALHSADAQGAAAENQAQLQERAELHQELQDHVMPALQSAGHWQSAACFMLTLLMPCLPHTHPGSIARSKPGFWEPLLNELTPVLQALALSQDTASAALEAFMSLLQACPDDVPSKTRLCRCFTGIMCLHLPQGDPECFASALAGVAKQCRPAVAAACCGLCCSMTRVGAPVEVQLQMVRALVSVVVYGSSMCLRPILELLSLQLRSFACDSDRERALAHIRHGLMHCHDFRKKPDCVRWFHAELSSL